LKRTLARITPPYWGASAKKILNNQRCLNKVGGHEENPKGPKDLRFPK